ncbi:uncharacterized protein BDZ83DRAFT_650548 [Colletotrichum acutatum]|uniref:Uncharacterized protein n=1 Tax=Glomerella acutata TaxID=27357 RepID=A0AAD8UN21_GLOAC|nr:uncharacterized protein BDZ83DRAFT_650548 [Colletotrichum acutatum]KAK1726378.1 hypothetical protein BDZ83DRAFT_650548 [Colletotrichum acutatum]
MAKRRKLLPGTPADSFGRADCKGGHLYDNLRAAEVFRRETLEYVRQCLRLSDDEAFNEIPTNHIITFLKMIGDAVCEAYDHDHRAILFDEIKFFVETSETEQQRRLSPELPSTAKAQQIIESIVPLLFRETESLNVAVSVVIETIGKAITEFNHAAACLMAKFADDETLASNIKAFIDGCKYICTGNLTWSFQTGRYGVSQHSISEGLAMRL